MKHRLPISAQLGLVCPTHRPGWWRFTGLALVFGAGLLLTACSSTPEVVRLHSLLESSASMATASDAAAAAGGPLRVVIAPVAIPSAVAQPQWLVRRSDDTVDDRVESGAIAAAVEDSDAHETLNLKL
jgi:hypothetical protein